ncbi:PadR family transcriptional regulator [Allokutzneria albata]|uniref:DNA-binding transcriptional regulator, PadR family n=1 Tax=Allokutzneria albata TaxID=211114 RepID=A0A1G9XCW4_ALLAB|nr:PadR family transcriptional regulator [Allokutzneria albata]SDM94371.1 DNA-binding transcriptional regulator, PadR family [Allokutzneria albata]
MHPHNDHYGPSWGPQHQHFGFAPQARGGYGFQPGRDPFGGPPPFPPAPPQPPGWGGGPGWGHGPGWERGRGRDPRAGRRRRGNVRAALLALLTERPMHGYEMIQEIAERSEGAWKPSPGSVYPTLQLLTDEGFVSTEEAEGRRLHTLTEAGRAEAEKIDTEELWGGLTNPVSPAEKQLREAYGQFKMALQQAAYAIPAEEQVRLLGILKEARRQIYTLLAEHGSMDDRLDED